MRRKREGNKERRTRNGEMEQRRKKKGRDLGRFW